MGAQASAGRTARTIIPSEKGYDKVDSCVKCHVSPRSLSFRILKYRNAFQLRPVSCRRRPSNCCSLHLEIASSTSVDCWTDIAWKVIEARSTAIPCRSVPSASVCFIRDSCCTLFLSLLAQSRLVARACLIGALTTARRRLRGLLEMTTHTLSTITFVVPCLWNSTYAANGKRSYYHCRLTLLPTLRGAGPAQTTLSRQPDLTPYSLTWPATKARVRGSRCRGPRVNPLPLSWLLRPLQRHLRAVPAPPKARVAMSTLSKLSKPMSMLCARSSPAKSATACSTNHTHWLAVTPTATAAYLSGSWTVVRRRVLIAARL